MASKPATMKDVARVAGVSIQTVSCVVNQTGAISPETRMRVLEVVEQLQYHRDPIARSMRTRQTGLIALLVSSIANPVLAKLASEVESKTAAENYSVILHNLASDRYREESSLEVVSNRLVDGVIIVNAVDGARAIRVLEAARIPAVMIDYLPGSSIPNVMADNLAGGYLATWHLIKLGHRKIAHLLGSTTHGVARQRYEGYMKALDEFGLEYRLTITPTGNSWGYAEGYESARQALNHSEPPTAIFASSDQMAIGAYRAIAEAGLRVPDDISVVGFDNTDAARFASPPLTTVHQPNEELAATAVALLVEMMGGKQPETTEVVLPVRLVTRQSTKERV